MITSTNTEIIITHKVIIIRTIQIIITIFTLTRVFLHAHLILRALIPLRALIILLAGVARLLNGCAHASAAVAPIAVQPSKALVILSIALRASLRILNTSERILSAVKRLLLIALFALIAFGASLVGKAFADTELSAVSHSAESLIRAEGNRLVVALITLVLGLVLAHAVDSGVAVVLASACLALNVALVSELLVGCADVDGIVTVERDVETAAVDAGVAGYAVAADTVEAASHERTLAVVRASLTLLGTGENPAGVVTVSGWYPALNLSGYKALDVSFRAHG